MNRAAPSLRLFYALWPDAATRDALMYMQAPLHGRKTRYQNLHMTLVFLGQQPADRLPVLKKILADLAPTPIALMLDRIGYFTKNQIAWAGTHDAPETLAALRHQLVQALLQNKVAFNDQSAFRPHITLARDAPPPEELPFEPFRWQVGQLALVESLNQAEGVHYHPLALHPLQFDA